MTPLERRKAISEIIATWVGLVGLVAGGLFGVVQYMEKDRGDKIKVTLDFLDRLNRSPVLDARKNVFEAWEKHRLELDEILNKQASGDDELDSLILRVVDQHRLFSSLITLIDYYDSLEICVAKMVCDEPTSAALFANDARVFFALHYPFIEKERQARSDASFAVHLERFAKMAPPGSVRN